MVQINALQQYQVVWILAKVPDYVELKPKIDVVLYYKYELYWYQKFLHRPSTGSEKEAGM